MNNETNGATALNIFNKYMNYFFYSKNVVTTYFSPLHDYRDGTIFII